MLLEPQAAPFGGIRRGAPHGGVEAEGTGGPCRRATGIDAVHLAKFFKTTFFEICGCQKAFELVAFVDRKIAGCVAYVSFRIGAVESIVCFGKVNSNLECSFDFLVR